MSLPSNHSADFIAESYDLLTASQIEGVPLEGPFGNTQFSWTSTHMHLEPGSLSSATRSLHCALFSGRTPGGLRRTRPIQNANFLALEWLELSGDFPVTFRCMLAGLVSPTDFSGGLTTRISPNEQSNSTGNDRTAAESPTEVQRTPTDIEQTAFLIIIIIKK